MSKEPEMDQDAWESDFWSSESENLENDPAHDSIDDTSDYLAAYDEAPASAFRYDDEQDYDDVNRYYDVNRYHETKAAKKHHRGAAIAAIIVFFLLVGVAVAAGIYINNINSRLTENVTDDLREQLVKKEPGEPFYLLLLGVDKDQSRVEDTENYGADEHAYRSDSIMLCRIDPKNVKVTMVSIHRDTLVNMDEHGKQKINAAYAFGGPSYTTKVVSEFAGVPISHYAEVDLDRFISIVDQVGGVTVNLPVPVYDPEYTELDLPAGVQTLDGTQAALLCRCRHGYDAYGDGDVYRAANQRMVFSAVIKKVLKSDPATIATTVASMADSVTTDLDVASILDLATQMQTLDVEKDIMTGMAPTEGALIDGTWYEICLVDDWRKMMMRVDRGESPYDETQGEKDSTAGVAGTVSKEDGATSTSSTSSATSSDASSASSTEEQATESPENAPENAPAPEEQGGDEYVVEYYSEEYY